MGGAILVVEDEPAIQELIAVNLEHAGHQVLRAANVPEAEALVREVLPDLVLLDWMLPGPPGVNFARQLRTDQRTKDIPIIMLTARAQDAVARMLEIDRHQLLDLRLVLDDEDRGAHRPSAISRSKLEGSVWRTSVPFTM